MLLPLLTCVFAWNFLGHPEISASSSEIDKRCWICHPNSSPSPPTIYITLATPTVVSCLCLLGFCHPALYLLHIPPPLHLQQPTYIFKNKKIELMDKYLFPTYNYISHLLIFKSVDIKFKSYPPTHVHVVSI